MLHGIVSDWRLAVRGLRSAPAITTAAVLTLTLGIGATTALFTVANGLAWRPLPVENPERLVTITSDTALGLGFQAGAGWSHAMWDRLRPRADAFEAAFAWTLQRLDLAEGGEMQPVTTLIASARLFDALGVRAVLGRTFTADDDRRGGGPDGGVAVISHRLWQRRFGGSRDVLGSRLLIERVPVTIVGVVPAGFGGVDVGQPFDVAIPFGTDDLVRGPRALMNSPGALLLTVMLRLKPGQASAEAAAALRAMQPDIVGPKAPAFLQEPFVVVDGSRGISDRSSLRQRYVYPLALLSAVSAIVLVMACLNIAHLLLSRASGRRAELSIRLALGAPRLRVARLHLVEALLLGTAGSIGGLAVAAWASRALVSRLPVPSGPVSLDLSTDWRTFGFAVGVTVVAVLLFGTMPAWYAARVPPIDALKGGGRTTTGGRGAWVSGGLVVTQVALSLVLLAAAGLFVRTVLGLMSVPLGFDPRGVLVVSVNTARAALAGAGAAPLDDRLLLAVQAVPGVSHAAASVWTPVGSGGGGLLSDARGRRLEGTRVAFNFVTPGWFDAYRTALRAGRDLTAGDGPTAPRVAVVNEALRRTVLAEGHPLGAVIHAGPCGDEGCTVVGVVGDAVYGQSLRDQAPPTVYMPLAQSRGLAPPNAPLRISVRAEGDLADVTVRVAAALGRVDPGLTFTLRRLDEDLEATVAQERLVAILAGVFGAVALLLCAIGLYGVSAYAATRRRTDIGVRLALGGRPRAIARVMLGRAALWVCVGAALGVAATLWLARLVAPLLYGLAPHDPVALLAAASLLVSVAAAAAWMPAWRATRADPARVLREV